MTTRIQRCWLIATGVLMLAQARSLRAAIWIGTDLDTLSKNAEVIVEGPIVQVQKDGWVQVRVAVVQKGTALKAGDAIVVNAATYTKPAEPGTMRGKPLEAGDTLFWFLKRDEQKAGEAETWSPLAGGAKLVFNGHVAEFSQHYMNPGPIVAEIEDEYVKRGQPTVEAYRKTIQESLVYVVTAEKELQAAIGAKDSKKLLEMLRERTAMVKVRPWGRDDIAGSINQALAEMHDYSVLDQAMKIEGLRGNQFRQGFATSEGIQYLLAKIMDTKLSSKQRIAYLNALPRYEWLPREGGLTVQAGFYLTNMAKWAVENEKDRELSQTFMNVVGSWALNSDRLDRQTRDDLYGALDQLKGLYRSTKDPAVQFQIEIIARDAGDAVYASLKSTCGPIISMVTMPENLDNYAKPEGRDIIAGVAYSFAYADEGEHTITHEPILLGPDGVAHRATYYAPDSGFRPGTLHNSLGLHNSSGFGCPIRPPADLPAGKYQLFVRFEEGGKVIGESHTVEVELPKPQ